MYLEDIAFVGICIACLFALALGHIIMKIQEIHNDVIDIKYYNGTKWGENNE